MFRCDLPPVVWQNDWGLLHATVVTLGVEWTPTKSPHTKLTEEKKIPPLLPRFKLHFDHFVRHSNVSIMSPVLLPTSCPGFLGLN